MLHFLRLSTLTLANMLCDLSYVLEYDIHI
jgi:hypothetical protein